MPKSEKQKLKILYTLDYLKRSSHADHPVGAKELIAMLAGHDIACDRKSVYSDIRALQDYGVDIETLRGKGGGFYIASRNFELPELKLLVDAVQSSRFLTEKKSRELISKLCTECSEDEARLIRREVLVSGRVKSMNESIYYNVDAIQEAIGQNRQISFRYFDWGIDGSRRYRDRSYTASPYGLCQDNENYYLLAHSPRHGVTSYRVDRMEHIRLEDVPREPCPELTGDGLTRYASRMFQMFSGEPTEVKFRFHRELSNAVMDRFGRNTMLIPDGEDHFVFTAQVAVSPLFLSWVIGFGDKAQILYPKWVMERCADLCRTALAQYQTSEKD
ncbi:MAG: WYL domain-containing transcriptional regulator [Clostridiales bacterium]|jgi:predicted DNA-binding transcriptional regulator YafY|nr:WYL domain-containing transcriptional regulator [Clostridiales bacterium]